MHVLVYSWYPPLEMHQVGGTQYLVRDLLYGLSAAGIHLTVLSPNTHKSNLLRSSQYLRILPILNSGFGRNLTPYEITEDLRILELHVRECDLVWSIDRPFPLQVPQPILLRVDNFSYDGEVSSVMSFTWDILIATSPYLGRVTNAVVGQEFWDGLPRPIQVIPNGIDLNHFKRVENADIRTRLGIDTSSPLLLFPHRPDPNKGFKTALKVISQLQALGTDHKLLIPVNNDSTTNRQFYRMLQKRIANSGLEKSVIFHDWLPLEDMPSYYSIGSYCLSLSVVPEGDGTTPIQSISCGTSLISTRAGGLRDLFPQNHGVHYVDFDDADAICEIIMQAPNPDDILRGRAYAKENFNLDRSIKEHIACFSSAKKNSSIYVPKADKMFVQISPWCHDLDNVSIWHEYKMKRVRLSHSEVDTLQYIGRDGIAIESLGPFGLKVDKLVSEGILCLKPLRINANSLSS